MTRALPLVVAALVVSAACNSDTPPVPTQPAPVTTEVFTGTVAPGGRDVHNFNVVLSSGLLTVTLTSAAPPPNVVLAVTLGQPDASGVCTALANATALTGASTVPQLSGNVSAGAYCTLVTDPGGAGALSAPVTYSITVTHY